MISLLLGPVATLLIVLLPMPGVAARRLERADWVVLGIALAVLALLAVGLLAAGATAPRLVGA